MGTAKRFEDLEVWQAARDLARETYRIANQGSFRRDFGLRDQITRAATSTMSNIAEGFERGRRVYSIFAHRQSLEWRGEVAARYRFRPAIFRSNDIFKIPEGDRFFVTAAGDFHCLSRTFSK